MLDNKSLPLAWEEITKLNNNKINTMIESDSIETLEKLLALKVGIYKLKSKNLYKLGVGYWTLTVISSLPVSPDRHIIAIKDATSEMYHFSTNGATDSEWVKMYNSSNKPTPDEIGAVNKVENGLNTQSKNVVEAINSLFLKSWSDENCITGSSLQGYWIKLKNNLIVQFGQVANAGTRTRVTFPIAFSSSLFIYTSPYVSSRALGKGDVIITTNGSSTLREFYFNSLARDFTEVTTEHTMWVAIGY